MSTPSQQNHNSALVVLTTLFFMMGFITCMNDILIPHLKEIFELTYVQAMLLQFSDEKRRGQYAAGCG